MPMTEEELKAAIETHEANVSKFETMQQSTEGLSSSEAKQLPWVEKLQADSRRKNELEKQIADDAAAKDKADAAEAIAKAEEAKDYAEAQRLKDDETKRSIQEANDKATAAESKALSAVLKAELLGVGFDARSIKVLASEYDAEKHDTIEAFADAAAADPSNKLFLSTSQKRQVATPPDKTSLQDGVTDWAEVKAWEQSTGTTKEDLEKRAKAREMLRAYRRDNDGAFPYKL